MTFNTWLLQISSQLEDTVRISDPLFNSVYNLDSSFSQLFHHFELLKRSVLDFNIDWEGHWWRYSKSAPNKKYKIQSKWNEKESFRYHQVSFGWKTVKYQKYIIFYKSYLNANNRFLSGLSMIFHTFMRSSSWDIISGAFWPSAVRSWSSALKWFVLFLWFQTIWK